MFRISNRMMYNNSLINAFRNNHGLLQAQEQLSSGKRINRPSDDPVGMMEVLQFRTDIGKADQYLGVMTNADSFLNSGDSVLGGVHDQLKTAKEQALAEAGGAATAETRASSAIMIDNMVRQMIQYGNSTVGSRYLFSGQRSELPAIDQNGAYVGSGKNMQAEINVGITVPISVKASDFLTADMNPAVSSANNGTLLSSLNGGSGVPAGSFNITDRAGNTVAVNTSAMTDVQDVITAINGGGTNITASISSDGTALVLTDSTVPPVLPIVVQSNATSQALGIAGTRNTSVFTGTDMSPAVTTNTLISDLYGGTGMALSNITINNAGASATVSFTGLTLVFMVRQMIQYGNSTVGSRYLFSGQRSELPAIDQNGAYVGSGKNMQAEINVGITVPISVKASDFLTADMNPAVSSANNGTLLSSLNGGSGVPAGSFNITDRAGNTVAVNTSAMTDVQDVITAINGGGTNITASISSDGTALVLTDSTVPPVLPIVVQSNATSQALGIAGTRNTSVFTGTDMSPAVTTNTLISDLYGGTGMALSNITINNAGASATVSFTGLTTVGQVISAINTAGAAVGNGVSAVIDPVGGRLNLLSGSPATVSFAQEIGTGKTAELLGIGGGRNIIPVLKMFSSALKADDTAGILGAIGLLDTNMETASSVRGTIGARVNQVSATREAVDQTKFDNTKLKSSVEDTDFLKAVSELAMLQSAYQATLKSSASIIQPSLLDFVR